MDKLIEIALPLTEINDAAIREKAGKAGHPANLHMWWGRSPLSSSLATLSAALLDFSAETVSDDMMLIENIASCDKKALEAVRGRLNACGALPTVWDAFAGFGGIPIAAGKLGLKSAANDLNPVAAMLVKAAVDIPARFASMRPVHPGAAGRVVYSGAEGLAEDIQFYGDWLESQALKRLAEVYPQMKNGEIPFAWLWVRTVKCPNPACNCRIPLGSSYILSKSKTSKYWAEPVVEGDDIHFEIHEGDCPTDKESNKIGSNGAKFRCPVCGEVTTDEYIKKMGAAHELDAEMIAVVTNTGGVKSFHLPDKIQADAANVKKLEDYFQEALPALKSNFLISLIEGRVSEEDYKRFLTAYQIDMKGPLFCCVVFHTSANHVPEGMDSLLLSMSVDREIKQRLAEKWKCQEFIYLGNTVLVLEVDTEENLVQITDECDRFCRWAYRIMGAVVTAGVGTTCESLYDISTSYEGAREAVSYRVLYGTKRAINIGEIVPKESKIQTQQEEARMHELFRAIHVGDEEEIEKAARKEIEKLHKNAKTIGQYNLATMEIVSGYFKFCSNNSLDFNEMSGNVPTLYQKVSQMDESALTSWIIGMSLKISEQLKNARNSTSRRLVTEAQNIVRERYMESEITLDDVCSALGVSNSYFSSIFKKEMGKSFISYLTDYRMDIAAEMILNTTEKSYTIAEKVGYLDANYFSYVFKKRFGMSPSKYRNEHLKK